MVKFKLFKGKHYCLPLTLNPKYLLARLGIYRIKINRLNTVVNFKFPEELEVSGLPAQVNKLAGFSNGYFTHHHSDSWRLGWDYDPISDEWEIYHYVYVNGVRNYRIIFTVKSEIEYSIHTVFFKNQVHYLLKVNDEIIDSTEITFNNTLNLKKYGRILLPYYGGRKPSPKNAYIYMSIK